LAANAIARDSGSGRIGRDSLKEVQDVIWMNALSGQRQYPIRTAVHLYVVRTFRTFGLGI
jgi:hypothetical protein